MAGRGGGCTVAPRTAFHTRDPLSVPFPWYIVRLHEGILTPGAAPRARARPVFTPQATRSLVPAGDVSQGLHWDPLAARAQACPAGSGRMKSHVGRLGEPWKGVPRREAKGGRQRKQRGGSGLCRLGPRRDLWSWKRPPQGRQSCCHWLSQATSAHVLGKPGLAGLVFPQSF